MKTVSQARNDLITAQNAYINAPHEQITEAKETLNNARHEYHEACSMFCTKLETTRNIDHVHSELITQGIW